jgi:hypothetical protein
LFKTKNIKIKKKSIELSNINEELDEDEECAYKKQIEQIEKIEQETDEENQEITIID